MSAIHPHLREVPLIIPTVVVAVSLALALTGCREDPAVEAPSSDPSAIESQKIIRSEDVSKDAAQSGGRSLLRPPTELSLLIWHEYISPDVVKDFEDANGVKVLITEASNSEEFKQTLSEEPSKFDLLVTDERTITELVSLKLLRAFEPEMLSSLPRTDAQLAPWNEESVRYSIPYLWGLTILAGKAEVLSDTEPSWSLLWRDNLKIGVLDEPFDLIWLGLVASGVDPAAATKTQIDEAVARLSRRFPDITSVMYDSVSGLDALESGELDLLVTYNGDGLTRASKNPNIRVAIPSEGAPIWIDGFALTRDAVNPELANQFILFLSNPESSARNATYLRYATPILEAYPHVEPALRADPSLYPTSEMMEKCRFVQFPEEVEKYVHQAASRLITGSRSRSVVIESQNATPSEED